MRRLLTPAEAATAFRIGEIYGRYEAANGLTRSVRSPSYESGMCAGSNATLTAQAQERIEAARGAWRALQAEFDSYPMQARASVRGLIEDLCVADMAVGAAQVDAVKKILRYMGRVLDSGRARKGRSQSAKLVLMSE